MAASSRPRPAADEVAGQPEGVAVAERPLLFEEDEAAGVLAGGVGGGGLVAGADDEGDLIGAGLDDLLEDDLERLLLGPVAVDQRLERQRPLVPGCCGDDGSMDVHGHLPGASVVAAAPGGARGVALQLIQETGEPGADLERLLPLAGLRSLDVCENQLTDAGLTWVASFPLLERLKVGHTAHAGAGLEHPRGLQHLRELTLDETDITNAGLERLSGLTELTRLGLQRARATGAGLDTLLRFKKLRHLRLHGASWAAASFKHESRRWRAPPDCEPHGMHRFAPGSRREQAPAPARRCGTGGWHACGGN